MIQASDTVDTARTMHMEHSRKKLPWLAAALAVTVIVPATVSAQSADNPPRAQRAHTLKTPPRNSKVLSGMERGTNAAGRGIDRAGSATERGVNNVSERASRPVRNLGERIGRKLSPGSSGHPSAPAVGPQGSAP